MRVIPASPTKRPPTDDVWCVNAKEDGVYGLVHDWDLSVGYRVYVALADSRRVAASHDGPAAALPFVLAGVPGWVWLSRGVVCWDRLGRRPPTVPPSPEAP